MKDLKENNISDEIIRKIALRISEKPINAPLAQDSRIFEYPHLDNVFIMESDLYGNAMPKDSCFLAFNGKHGMVGKHMTVEALTNSSMEDIRQMVENNTNG